MVVANTRRVAGTECDHSLASSSQNFCILLRGSSAQIHGVLCRLLRQREGAPGLGWNPDETPADEAILFV